MKILVLTFIDKHGIYRPVIEITQPNHEKFCKHRGYDYKLEILPCDITKNVLTPELSLERSKLVRKYIDEYDVVVEIGSDIIFTNFNKKFEDIIQPNDNMIMAKEGLNTWPVNDDVLVWNKTEKSIALLDTIINEFPVWRKMQWIRQSWLAMILESANPIKDSIRVVEARVMNSHPQPSVGCWEVGDFICHCLGLHWNDKLAACRFAVENAIPKNLNSDNNMAILFTHHNQSELTMHHYNLLKRFNPNANIFPVGFYESSPVFGAAKKFDLIPGSHAVHRSEELPTNYVLDDILKRGSGFKGNSSESDLLIYDFFLHHQDFDSYFLVEYDTYCNCSIEECYSEAFKKYDMFCSQMLTNEFYGPGTGVIDDSKLDINTSEYRYVKRGSWYRYFFSKMNETTEQKKLLPYLGSASTTSLMYLKHDVLYSILELLLANPPLYNDIQNEMRLGTLIQQAGYKLTEFGGRTNDCLIQENFMRDIENKVSGYYHPIKEIINPDTGLKKLLTNN